MFRAINGLQVYNIFVIDSDYDGLPEAPVGLVVHNWFWWVAAHFLKA
jgi:hypothetical protein